jgi:uncharacterized phage-associated protein
MDNSTFNIEKALNAVLYIALHVRRSDFHKIFKILYFSDREHLIEYGRAITGDNYYAMEYGPVPTRLYDIFKSVGGKGYYKDDGTFSQYFSVVDNNILKPQKEPDMRTLSKSDVKHLDDSIKLYGNLSMAELIEKSHDYAWKSTGYGMEIDLGNIILEAGGDDDFIQFVKENYCARQIEECEYA